MHAVDDDDLSFPDPPRLDLDEALTALMAQAERFRTTQGRLRDLLTATRAVLEESDLTSLLHRIVEAAATLVDAEYGALGVLTSEGDALEQFVYVGIDDESAAKIGHLPTGHGLLGQLIVDPRPIRLESVSAHPSAEGFPAHHPPMDSFLGVPLRVRGAVFGNLYLTNRRTGTFTKEDEQLVGALAASAGFAVENARLLQHSRTREKWMAAAAELSASLLSSPTETAFDLIAGRIHDLADVDRTMLVLTGDDAALLHIAAARGEGESRLRGMTTTVRAGELDDALVAGAMCALASAPASHGEAFRVVHAGVAGPALVAPLRSRARLWGATVLVRAPDRARFSDAEIESIGDFASRASIALELAHAREEQQRARLADDRRRIARDLHDHVIQQLFGTGLTLQAIAGSMAPGHQSESLRESVGRLDDAISQIRTVIFALSGSDDTSTRHRVLDVIAELSASLDRPPSVRFSGPVDHVITAHLADDVIAVVRELLSNAVHHSRADNLSVEVGAVDASVVVAVEDDGVSIPADAHRSGLSNLEERAVARGGVFLVDSVPGRTKATWRVPVRDEGDREDAGEGKGAGNPVSPGPAGPAKESSR
ncbi:GAF domain-containing protein [Microbacterium sp. SLBN-146]|uniref:sensor histidine kinase n=1 Tax=Microbacterium sp. SLBN-146 TaxID=2768457 RepID=UPI0011687682|nr:GAF domain-containing protein [Microbacterium sp. SLBN-146]TQJ31317.1 histidine kinase/DNA gyrase B/HSP90-like ATPase [Microbacterium sp. SLBN-146]